MITLRNRYPPLSLTVFTTHLYLWFMMHPKKFMLPILKVWMNILMRMIQALTCFRLLKRILLQHAKLLLRSITFQRELSSPIQKTRQHIVRFIENFSMKLISQISITRIHRSHFHSIIRKRPKEILSFHQQLMSK